MRFFSIIINIYENNLEKANNRQLLDIPITIIKTIDNTNSYKRYRQLIFVFNEHTFIIKKPAKTIFFTGIAEISRLSERISFIRDT